MSSVYITLILVGVPLILINFFFHSALLALVLFIDFVGLTVLSNRPGGPVGGSWPQDVFAVLSIWAIVSVLVYLLPGKKKRRV